MKVKINDAVYSDSLLFYTMMKYLVQSGLNEAKLDRLGHLLEGNRVSLVANPSLISKSVLTGNPDKHGGLLAFADTSGLQPADKWIDLAAVSCYSMSARKLLIEEAKHYAIEKAYESIAEVSDRLSLRCDMAGLSKPYGERVDETLIVSGLSSKIRRDSAFILNSSDSAAASLFERIDAIQSKYGIDIGSIYSLILGESVNQSIRSDAGIGYESCVLDAIQKLGGATNIETHVHDSKIPALEYDFRFDFAGRKVGVSAKKTLRERYKQNHEHTDLTDVAVYLVITLGTDLSESTMNNILQKRGNYIVVASEVWEARPFLKRDLRIIPSDGFTGDKLRSLLG